VVLPVRPAIVLVKVPVPKLPLCELVAVPVLSPELVLEANPLKPTVVSATVMLPVSVAPEEVMLLAFKFTIVGDVRGS
jgi:hypothetical protein